MLQSYATENAVSETICVPIDGAPSIVTHPRTATAEGKILSCKQL